MRKFRRILLLTAVLAGALCVSALAAEPTEAGVYGMTTETGITVTPQKADGTAIDASTQGDYSGYYAGAVKFGVEATGLKAGSQYLLLMVSGDGAPGADNIVYIDQQAADANGTVAFTAYPQALGKGSYRIFLLGGEQTLSSGPAASFQAYVPYTLGDVNDDGTIDSADALEALLFFVESKTPTETERLAADVNKDGTIDSYDALQMLRYFVEEIHSFD
mgnify:FL=1